MKDIRQRFGRCGELCRALQVYQIEDEEPEQEKDVILFFGEVTVEFIHTCIIDTNVIIYLCNVAGYIITPRMRS